MTANFGEESRCRNEHQAPTVIVASGYRDALGELPCKLFDRVLLVSAPRLQASPARSRAATPSTRSHDHTSGRIGTEIAVVSRRERVLEGFDSTWGSARLAQLEHGGVPRIRDENGVATHRCILRVETF